MSSFSSTGAYGAVTGHTFGKRETPPALPGYICWVDTMRHTTAAVIFAPDGFTARQDYARQRNAMYVGSGLTVTDIVAVRAAGLWEQQAELPPR